MNRIFSLTVLLLSCVLSQAACASTCVGKYSQSIRANGTSIDWIYSIENNHISGKTILDNDKKSFVISGAENPECLISGRCSVRDMSCALGKAMSKPAELHYTRGRIKVQSFGVYLAARKKGNEEKSCSTAYNTYHAEYRFLWSAIASTFVPPYHIVEFAQSTEISLERPTVLGQKGTCFEDPQSRPRSWREMDFFPMLLVELKK